MRFSFQAPGDKFLIRFIQQPRFERFVEFLPQFPVLGPQLVLPRFGLLPQIQFVSVQLLHFPFGCWMFPLARRTVFADP